MNVLELLKIAAPAASPAASPTPPPNAVNAPSVNAAPIVSRNRFVNVPRVAASKPTGQSPNYSAAPLQAPAPMPAGMQQPVVQDGMLLSPEEAAMQQQAQAEMQAQNDAGKKESPAPPKQDTLLTSEILNGWSNRLSKASYESFEPVQYYPRGSSLWNPSAKGGVPGGFPTFSSYNPFSQGSLWHGGYDFVKKMLTNNLINVQARPWADQAIAQAPQARYSQALARNLADPVHTGSSENPLLTLGANLASSFMGGKAPDAAQLGQTVDTFRSSF